MKAIDALSHESGWSNGVTVLIDNTPPVSPVITSSTHPNPDSYYSANVPVFNFAATDQHSGIKGYYYLVDQNPASLPDTNAFWTTDSTVTISNIGSAAFGSGQLGLPDGIWYFHEKAMDNVGNLGEVSHRKVEIDTSAPSTFDDAPDGWVSSAGIVLDAHDTLSEVAKTFVSVDGGQFIAANSIQINTAGNHHINYYSVDNAGNTESTKTATVKVDNVPPVITINEPENIVYVLPREVVLDFSATDDVSGMASLSASLDGTPVNDGQTIDLATLEIGSHNLVVTAKDVAGNEITETREFDVEEEFTPDANTLLLMHFNEGSGTTTTDAQTGRTYDITNADWEPGLVGSNALGFTGGVMTGVYRFVDIGSFNITGPMTVEALVKPNSNYGVQSIADSLDNFGLWVENGKVSFGVFDMIDGMKTATSKATLPIGKTTKVSGTYDHEKGEICVYINNKLDNCENYKVTYWVEGVLRIGQGFQVGDFAPQFDGTIDELRISNVVRK
ncbi:MAG: hypothetical protein HZA83_01000 [Thaumarchaeota archaeon]|nr:hypothetical protein [Nitrososphaerota archaeon]